MGVDYCRLVPCLIQTKKLSSGAASNNLKSLGCVGNSLETADLPFNLWYGDKT